MRRDPALQYDDLRSRLNWGPTFKNAKISESPISMPQLKSKREIIAPSNVPLASNLDSPRLFAAKELGFLVLPRKMNPNKPRWSDAISHYQELASQQINYSSI